MDNRTALGLGAVILLALGLDFVLQGGEGTLFLLRKFADLIDYVAFWR